MMTWCRSDPYYKGNGNWHVKLKWLPANAGSAWCLQRQAMLVELYCI